jgi:SAM-dependent methyltransferase
MIARSLCPYADPKAHQAISKIIRNRSTNRTDVRHFAVEGLDLSCFREVLGLGCGFGFLVRTVGARVAPGARLTGVDACASNEEPFLKRVATTGLRGRFQCSLISSKLPWPDDTFDLVVCSYSLYFFPEALSEAARVLTPDGLLLALTHSERSFAGLLRATGIGEEESSLKGLVQRFSAENGTQQLNRFFERVERVDYPNLLRFGSQHFEELLAYIRFKLPFLSPGTEPDGNIPEPMLHSVEAYMAAQGEVVVEKDDACFRCWRPRCR